MSRNGLRHQRRNARFEQVLRYIESNYLADLDVQQLARMASVSTFHFHRRFSAYLGVPVYRFIRRLRIEHAARSLLFHDLNVTNAAAIAGYATPAAFARAFRQHFGLSPLLFVRDRAARRPAAAAMPVGLSVESGCRLLPDRSVLCVQRHGSYDRSPWEAWRVMRAYLTGKGVRPEAVRRYGLPLDWPEVTAPRERRYVACVDCDLPAEGEFFKQTLAGGSHATFLYQGRYRDLQKAHEAIFWNWFPGSGMVPRSAPAVHVYLDADETVCDAAALRTEIHVPIEARFNHKAA